MAAFETIDQARAFFEGDRFAANSGIGIDELGEDWCVCSMLVTREHQNANGGVMGGAIFTLGDFAFAVASNQVHKITVAQQVSINFLSAAREGRLFARAQCKKNGKTTCVFNVDIYDEKGRDIAQFIGSGFKL